MEIMTTRVAGVSYCQDATKSCIIDDPVTLICEPENPHDKNAVRVDHYGNKIGYLPRPLAAQLTDLVAKGKVAASIVHVLGGGGAYNRGIELSLEIQRPKISGRIASIEHVEIPSLLDVLSGNLLDEHDLDTGVRLGAEFESLQQTLSQCQARSCDHKELGAAAANAYKKCREDLTPGNECSDSLRIAGVVSIILNDESLGVFAYSAMHAKCEAAAPPKTIMKLLSLLQLKFEPSSENATAYQAAADQPLEEPHGLCAIARMYFVGNGVQKDSELAFDYYAKAVLHLDGLNLILSGLQMPDMSHETITELDVLLFRVIAECPLAKKVNNKKGIKGTTTGLLAICYRYGIHVKQDHSKAVELYQKAADLGQACAMYSLGVCYANGEGVKQDYSKAVEWYQKAADLGNQRAMYNLGVCYRNGADVEQDYTKAAEWYQKAADLGNSNSMYSLGVCYRNGEGVKQDHSKAVEWFQKAADLGHPGSMHNLGVCYNNGADVKQDYTKAAEWFQKAADLGQVDAMFSLAIRYTDGEGVKQDHSKAVEWFQKAADLGHPGSMHNLGVCYNNGEGVKQDHSKAVEWYQKAADLGNQHAMASLSARYEKGSGVEQDDTKAVEWYKKAADSKDSAYLELHKLQKRISAKRETARIHAEEERIKKAKEERFDFILPTDKDYFFIWIPKMFICIAGVLAGWLLLILIIGFIVKGIGKLFGG